MVGYKNRLSFLSGLKNACGSATLRAPVKYPIPVLNLPEEGSSSCAAALGALVIAVKATSAAGLARVACRKALPARPATLLWLRAGLKAEGLPPTAQGSTL